jgi:chondroitin sulfate N-acetylgalactosaminyltransferase 1/2
VHFELIFNNKTSDKDLKATVIRPFAPFELYSVMVDAGKKQTINVILPLAGRIASFKSFISRFYRLSMSDGHITLTIIYFGQSGLAEVEQIIANYAKYIRPKLFVLNETFSRAKALRVGSSQFEDDALLFFCDVDVVFLPRFLKRCRWNTIPGRQVYYPILFSLYNPQIVYNQNGKPIPPEHQQLIISKDTGFWRDFGYGMTCQYRYNQRYRI